MRAFDLFSGCGGLTEGLKNAGITVVGAVEIDALAVETYQANHPEVRVWPEDIETLFPYGIMAELGLAPGDLDLLAGCPPCQGFSMMRTHNRRKAEKDSRNDLVYSFLRFVTAMLPKTVMMENVPGLAYDERLRHVVRRLVKLGYRCRFRVLNAAQYGVPQRRLRLILIASRLGGDITFARPERRTRTVRNAIARMPPPGETGDPLHDLAEHRSAAVIAKINAIPRNGGSRTDLPAEQQLACHQRTRGFRDVYGRMKWHDVAPTITGGCVNPSKGRFLHPHQNRAITLREAALLQTFRRDYTFSLRRGKMHAALMIGNALPPEFIRRQASCIVTHLREHSVE